MKFYVKTKLSENISETPEGYLLCRNVPLTHTGRLTYVHPEHPFGEEAGEVVITRKPEQLFSKETLSSFEGKDITIQHPEEFVNPENYQELTNGVMFNLRRSPEQVELEGEMVEMLLGDFLIKSSEAIELVKSGQREVSLGYDALWVQTADHEGVHEQIRGNHCALVEQGRAGMKCAINDHKRGIAMTLQEKFKKLFGKTVDEAVAEKEKESKDEEAKKVSDLEAKVKDLEAKLSEKEEKKEESKEESKDEEKEESEESSKDEDKKEGEEEKVVADDGDVDSRLAKLEEMVTSLLKKLAGDSDESEEVVADEEEEEEAVDNMECMEGEDEAEEKEDKKKSVGDALSKAEILAPGIKESKTLKKDALAVAYKTADGKKVIDALTGGKCPSKLSAEAEEAVFNAAAEMLKVKRVSDFAIVKVSAIDAYPSLKGAGAKTAEDINKQNAEFYGNKQ